MVNIRGAKVLAGTVSSGHGCARAGYPGIYTNAAKFVPWIRRNAL